MTQTKQKRNKLYGSFGHAPPPPVCCRECRQTVAGAKWNRGMGWLVPSHRSHKAGGGGFCKGIGTYGKPV